MKLAAFDRANLKSRPVRFFFHLLIFLTAGYALGWFLYAAPEVPDRAMAEQMASHSADLFVVAVMFVIFLVGLRWHILRTLILAMLLLSLAYLYCALILLLFDSYLAHAAVLLSLCGLFFFLFITQSNLLIYLRDRTYADIFLEGTIAVVFLGEIIRMLSKALGLV